MKTKKPQKRKNSDFYEDSIPRNGLKSAGKKDRNTKKRLSIYEDFNNDEEDDFAIKPSRR